MASKNVQVLNELNFDTLVLNAQGTILVDFTATWCGPCRLQSAILEQFADEPGAPVVATVDVDDCPELAARFGIRGMPTLVAFSAGKETGRRLGLTREAGIRSLVAAPAAVQVRDGARA
jgi:thioredoxin 1